MDVQKEDYVKNYKAREGIDLDTQHIEKNRGRKATAKLMLNSFRGKFGEQGENYTNHRTTRAD